VDSFKSVSRTGVGVRGIKLSPDDKVVSMKVISPDAYLLTVTSKGFGKLSPISAFPTQQRSRKGVQAHKISEKAGGVVATKLTSPAEELMLISDQGIIIRVPIKSIPIQGRSTRGIRLMRLAPQDKVVSIACLKGKR